MLKPIRNKTDYAAAMARIDQIIEAKKGTAQFDELEVLSILVESYETKHYHISPPDPVEAIKFRMEQMGLKRKDLEPYIGSRARISEILNHKRNLSLNMIRKLHKNFGIPADSLV